jgi:protein-S-isoprenylcysteine O-methyltransferase Ste14
MEFLKFFLPAYIVAFVGLAFVWRSYRTWKRTGVNPYKFGHTDSAHDFTGKVYRMMLVVLAVVIGCYALAPAAYQYFAPFAWLEHVYVQITGICFLMAALLWIVVAQAQMSDSWRIGIDRDVNTPLVRRGLFRFSRNPIFLGMRLTLFGFFLVLPNAATLAVFLVGDVLMQVQVRLEEEFLVTSHGKEYTDYCNAVRRWV